MNNFSDRVTNAFVDETGKVRQLPDAAVTAIKKAISENQAKGLTEAAVQLAAGAQQNLDSIASQLRELNQEVEDLMAEYQPLREALDSLADGDIAQLLEVMGIINGPDEE